MGFKKVTEGHWKCQAGPDSEGHEATQRCLACLACLTALSVGRAIMWGPQSGENALETRWEHRETVGKAFDRLHRERLNSLRCQRKS